ncbi:hypothetical protein EFP14_08945 [Lactiplantibacillus pentosus]|jgi:hypothetical protein|nr:hypothetical protein [Lactiplantibacillus pentosus]MCT3293229.1 hypothetical protein [Lactiplantibacillus pentosus]
MPVLNFKNSQLRSAGSSANYRRHAVIGLSYAGFQAFWAMGGQRLSTALEGKKNAHVWTNSKPIEWHVLTLMNAE